MAIRILPLAIPLLLMTSTALAAPLSDKAALSDDELADMRGGFLTAGGAQFDFGASIKTMVNGQVALQTSLQWTNAGAVTQQLAGLGQSIQAQVGDAVASNLAKAGIASPIGASNAASPAAASNPIDVASNAVNNAVDTASNAAAAGQAAAATATNAPAAATPVASTASTPSVITGVQVPGVGGSTQVFANLSPGQIQSIILNSASGQTITQNTDVTFTIYNFQAWQQQLAEHALSARLASEMLAASGFAAGH